MRDSALLNILSCVCAHRVTHVIENWWTFFMTVLTCFLECPMLMAVSFFSAGDCIEGSAYLF